MINVNRLFLVFSLILLSIFIFSCDNTYSPKPMGYLRIDLPEKSYRTFDSVFPYSFAYPEYAKIVLKKDSLSEPYWMNIVFPEYKGTIYLSYKPVKNNLRQYLEDARKMVMKHIPKANSIDEKFFSNPSARVYGTFYDIKGNNAASPYQFYLTDSTQHFIRGALYFYVAPNNDSLAPVIDFLKKDIDKFAETLRWK